ncbi:MAG: DUF4263 domain-containing protein [Bacteroidales bacterium]|nr:DUF4263 domain-containing protein [Bacteroidales bacterium]
MSTILGSNPFANLFDLQNQDISSLIIKENSTKDNCYIQSGSTYYNGFIIANKPTVKTLCNVSFYRSKIDNKYLPRLEFRKEDKNGEVKISKGNDVIIRIDDGEYARNFWKLIHFLEGFKDLVDLGDFHSKYQAVSFDNYLVDFKTKDKAKKFEELVSLTENTNLSSDEIKSLLFPQRKKTIKSFYYLLKDYNYQDKSPFELYSEKKGIKVQGEEVVWHHFLKDNEWIIGLNVDVKFIRDLLSEQKIGTENSLGKGSPKIDLIGISYFTTLIELKTSKTLIFKSEKTSKSRSNTWDFSNDFIEAYSQALAQKSELNDHKKIIDENGNEIDNSIHRILDPKSVLIIGNRNEEFPHIRTFDLNIKSDCFERLRRDNRNIEIITYDELFERAFHIVYSEKLPKNWYSIEEKVFLKDILKFHQ